MPARSITQVFALCMQSHWYSGGYCCEPLFHYTGRFFSVLASPLKEHYAGILFKIDDQ